MVLHNLLVIFQQLFSFVVSEVPNRVQVVVEEERGILLFFAGCTLVQWILFIQFCLDVTLHAAQARGDV